MTNHPNRSRKIKAEFTRKELGLLLLGLGNGIGDDTIECLGLTKEEMALLGSVANRLNRALNGEAPYYESISPTSSTAWQNYRGN